MQNYTILSSSYAEHLDFQINETVHEFIIKYTYPLRFSQRN